MEPGLIVKAIARRFSSVKSAVGSESRLRVRHTSRVVEHLKLILSNLDIHPGLLRDEHTIDTSAFRAEWSAILGDPRGESRS